MLPLSDVIRPQRTPWLTVALIGFTLATFVTQLLMGADRLAAIIYAWGLIPETRVPVTFVTSLVWHPGAIDALANAGALWIFGPNVEDRMGRMSTLGLYLVAGVVGGICEVWFRPMSPFPLVGTSGAVAGLVGAYFVMYPTARALFLVPVPFALDIVEAPAVLLVGVWFLLVAIGADASLSRGLVSGTPPVVAQLGGGLAGALVGWLGARRVDWSRM